MGLRSRRRAASFISLLLAALIAATALPSAALAAKKPGPRVSVPSAILVSSDGTVLWSKRPDAVRRVASTTKMLTALVVRDRVPLDQTITVSAKAASVDGGDVGLRAGQKLTVRQLLAVMLVHSANGAAEALAIGVAGSEKKFVRLMDAKADALGLEHTRPADPHGLSPKGVSTASDLAIVARELMADPVLRSIVRQRSAWLPWGGYSTTDRMFSTYRGLEGIKTGYTDPAGYCFVGAAKRNGVELYGVVLGADSPGDRFTQMTRLLDWGFAHAKVRQVVSADATMGVVDVSGGWEPTVTVRAVKPVSLTVCDSGGPLTTQLAVPATLKAPVHIGQQVGSVCISQGGSVIATVALVANGAVTLKPATPAPAPAPAPAQAGVSNPAPSLWQRIAGVWADLGRMLGV